MSELAAAIKQICDEKGLSYEAVLTTIESALAAAYRKDFGKKNQNIVVEYNPETMKTKIFDVKTVVEDQPEEEEEDEESAGTEDGKAPSEEDEKKDKKGQEAKTKDEETHQKREDKKEDSKDAEKTEDEKDLKDEKKTTPDSSSATAEEEEEEFKFNPKTMIELSDAKLVKKTAKIGDEIKMKLDVPEGYGRMAAQTAKQVIIQRLREAERDMIFNDFKEKEHEVVSGVVQRREGKVVLVDLGKAVGILTPDEMIQGEQYRPGDRAKVYVKEVNSKPKGPEILLSRTSDEILKKVFYLEIPEIANGLIEIKSVAREAGYRAKVAVHTDSDNVDPIGSCVGQRGARIQTIITELGGEKVDIITYSDDPASYITNALSPAKVMSIDFNEDEGRAKVNVSNDQLSLAIGKGGQNARLAAKLTGWKIDIVEESGEKVADETGKVKEVEEEKTGEEAAVDTEAIPVSENENEEASSKEENSGEKNKEDKKDQEATEKDEIDHQKHEDKKEDSKDAEKREVDKDGKDNKKTTPDSSSVATAEEEERKK